MLATLWSAVIKRRVIAAYQHYHHHHHRHLYSSINK